MDKKINFSEDFWQKVQAGGSTPKDRLIGLTLLLSLWNKKRLSEATAKTLSVQDIDKLRDWIRGEVEKTAARPHEAVADQILFLILGALQLTTQKGSDKTWALVNRSITDSLSTTTPNKLNWALAGLVTLMVFGIGLILHQQNKHQTPSIIENGTKQAITMAVVGPETLSTLVEIRNKMKDGTCQFPQAAMLAIDQRQAYLSFLNEGVVDVNNVDNLKLALGHVNCLYPQQLMYAPL